MRARRGLGMELQRDETVAREPLDRAVVEGDVADLGCVAGLDGEAVVLCGQPVTRTG